MRGARTRDLPVGPVTFLVAILAVVTVGRPNVPIVDTAPTARRVTASDAFDRPDAPSLGTTDTGQRWREAGRASWRIARHRAGAATTSRRARGAAFVDAGVSDGVLVRARIRLSPTSRRANAGLAFHVIDARSYLFAKIEVTTSNPKGLMSIGMVNRGRTRSLLASKRGVGLKNGRTYRVRLAIDGRRITMRVGGGNLSTPHSVTYRLTRWQQDRFGSSSRFGLRAHIAPDEDDGRSRWDDFAVVSIS